MGETHRRASEVRARREQLRRRAFHVGEDALRFTKWYAKGKYALMEGFLGELDDAPHERDVAALRERYWRAISHGRRVAVARTIVTILLALGAVTTAVAAVANVALVPETLEGDVAFASLALARVAAWAAASSVVLVMLRLAFDRYLDLVDTSATFLAMQLSASPRGPRA